MTDRRGVSPFVTVAVVLAALVGIVAIVLVGGNPKPPSPHAGELVVTLPADVWGLIFISPLLAGFSALILRRILGGSLSFSHHFVLQAVVFGALLLLFVYLLTLGAGNGPGTVTVVTKSPPNPSPNITTNVTSPTINTSGMGSSVTVPSWGLFGLVIVPFLIVVILAGPGVLALVLGRRRDDMAGAGRSSADQAEARNALAEASSAIERGEDPRATIVRLYLRLLERFGGTLGNVSHLTPEEIRATVFAHLNVRADAAEALTRLFEEARYSLHSMGPEAADRCRSALGMVEADLARPAAS